MTEKEEFKERQSSKLRNVAAVFGALGVAAAAYGAHGLERVASPEQIRWWAIAAGIQLLTVPGILVVAVLPQRTKAMTGWLWVLGVLLFSGSLYAMALGGPRFLGAVTPLGGLALISGWLSVVFEPQPSTNSDPESPQDAGTGKLAGLRDTGG